MIYFGRSEALGLEGNVICTRGRAPTGVSPWSGEWDMQRNTQRGSMGVQCEEGEPGAIKKCWYSKAVTF